MLLLSFNCQDVFTVAKHGLLLVYITIEHPKRFDSRQTWSENSRASSAPQNRQDVESSAKSGACGNGLLRSLHSLPWCWIHACGSTTLSRWLVCSVNKLPVKGKPVRRVRKQRPEQSCIKDQRMLRCWSRTSWHQHYIAMACRQFLCYYDQRFRRRWHPDFFDVFKNRVNLKKKGFRSSRWVKILKIVNLWS